MDQEKNSHIKLCINDINGLGLETYSESSSKDPLDIGEPVAGQDGHKLKQALQARHITMIAIGGALGTGLLIGTSKSLATAGPGSILIAYSLVGAIVYFVMCALGEMASFIPLPEGFAGYATRYCDSALGFAVGIAYLIKYLIVAPNQLVAGAMVMQYWVSAEKVNPGVWITIILVLVLVLNLLGVKWFGEFEFWLSSLKVVTVLGLIILLLVIMLGGGPTHDRLGFRYWTDPGAFAPYKHISNEGTAKFVAFWSVMVMAVFAYLGTELVGITFAEAVNPRHSIKRAIKLTFYRIVLFYVVSVFLLGCCVAYNNPELVASQKASAGAAASPFVIAISNAQIGGLNHLLNACILIFVISATNSDVYIATRNSYGLAANGMFFKLFARTNKNGIPVYSLILSGAFCCLAYMSCSSNSSEVFGYFVNVVSIFGLLTWVSILVTYLYFMRAVKAQGYDRTQFTYFAPMQPYGTWFALFFCILIALTKNFTVFIGEFNYKDFITGYIGIPVFLICLFGYKMVYKTKTVNPYEADLITYKARVDQEEQEHLELLASQPKLHWKQPQWWYQNTLGLLF